MIKIFCDCCGEHINPYNVDCEKSELLFPVKRVSIEPCSEYGSTEDFLVGFTVHANIYKPKDLMDNVHEAEHIGWCICPKCIVKYIQQKR